MLKMLSFVAAFAFLAGCQHNTPVQTWNSPEEGATQEEQSLPTETMPEEQVSSMSDVSMHPSVMGAPVGTYKIGKPYNVDGMTYTPAENYSYQAEGMSSWYGAEFAGQKTANGAIFDPAAYTAAHKTLPLPSVIKVTNLDTGKSTYARVNDRGPFTKNRLVDVSEAVAEEIGMKQSGTARVSIEVMEAESKQLKMMAMANGTDAVVAAAPTALDPSEMAPAAIAPMATTGAFYVQAGALASSANAEQLRARITSAGNSSVVNEGGYYKVRVGPFNTIQEAQQARNALQATGVSNPGLIKDGKWSRW
ncbi:MAG: septal ring lytic transglycosylase RlpA family protein [Alphaproteobacteria bacterium]|nr:septal ring lytic transglycosylase RlpA family protein [Alphaproteobacteria bacterium]